MKLRALGIGLTICGVIYPTTSALADETEGIERHEIIVTARKREESIIKVPVVAVVLGREQLEAGQISTLMDISSLTTGVVLGTNSLESGTQISLRGIGTTASDPGIDQSVSLNIDGMQLTQGSAFSVGVFDMAQVEILKGPQALFYGKSSPGGVMSIRTADPGSEFEMMGRVAYEAEAREWRGEAIVSGPVTDTLGLRLAAMYSDSDGFFKNTAIPDISTGAVQPAKRFGATETLFLRGTAVFEPSSRLKARLKVNYTRDRQTGGAPYQLYSCPDGTTSYTGFAFFGVKDACKIDRALNIVDLNPAFFKGIPNGGRPYTNITQKFGVLELGYELTPELSITSVTGYYKIKVNALMNGTVTGSAVPTLAAEKYLRREDFTQEVRINSDFDGPVNFTSGMLYQNGEIQNAIRITGNSYFNMPPILQRGSHDVDIETISLFGQLRVKPVEALEIAVGARWTSEKRDDLAETIDVFGTMTGTAGASVYPALPKLKARNWSPELTISYSSTEDFMVFGSLKQAYKSGSYNLGIPVNPGGDNSFGDEKIRGGEVGLKTRFADRQVMLNIAGYYYKYNGLQVGVYVSQPNALPILRTQNAGAARIYGVDFDLTYAPQAVPGLNIRSAINWNRAHFTSFENAPCWGGQTQADGCDQLRNPNTGNFTAQDLSGARLPRAPEWQATLGFTYEQDLGRSTKVRFGADGQYSSKFLATLGRRADFFQNKYVKLNANVAVVGPNDGWEVALIGQNLTNIIRGGYCGPLNYAGAQTMPGMVTGGQTRGAAGIDEVHCIVDRGRAAWLRLTFRPSELFGR